MDVSGGMNYAKVLEANYMLFLPTVIEPLRAENGRCGPPHKNATCVGSDMGQCCNSETWTCGDSMYVGSRVTFKYEASENIANTKPYTQRRLRTWYLLRRNVSR